MSSSGESPPSGSSSGKPRRRRRRPTATAPSTPSSATGSSPSPPRGKGGGSTAKSSASTGKRATKATAPRASRPRLPKVEETSAGGLVVDRSAAVPVAALIARYDRRGRLVWSLPKGHVEKGETPEQAALREVEEETGILGQVLAPLGVIDFWFIAENRRIHKTVHHFLMEAVGGELSDEDAEVVEVAWVPLEGIRERLAYADERRLIDRLPDLKRELGGPDGFGELQADAG